MWRILVNEQTAFYDVMPPSQRAVRQRRITSGHVTRLDDVRLAVCRSHVV